MPADDSTPPQRKQAQRKQAQQVDTLARTKEPTMVSEFVYFLGTNKKWWLTPIIVILLLLGVLVLVGGSGAGPFIYTVF